MSSSSCSTIACRPLRSRDEAAVKRVSTFRPSVDVLEEPSEFRIIADVPGVKPENIAIEFEQGVLIVTAHVPERAQPKASMIREEYGVGDFRRVFRISEAIDPQQVQAEYAEGILVIRLPKTDSARRRRIDVKVT